MKAHKLYLNESQRDEFVRQYPLLSDMVVLMEPIPELEESLK